MPLREQGLFVLKWGSLARGVRMTARLCLVAVLGAWAALIPTTASEDEEVQVLRP